MSTEKLKKYGYRKVKTKSRHELARYEGDAKIIFYKTGKILVQGKKEYVTEAKRLVNYLGLEENKNVNGQAVGTDESLKGDTFGGIVVAGFKADDKIRQELKAMGVKDSKMLLKPEIVKLAEELIDRFPGCCHVESLTPKEYNKMNMTMNVTQMLDRLHEKCYKKLSRSVIHIVDLYPGCAVGNIREAKADSKYLDVAAASIIARFEGLKQIRELEQKAGFFIPMGSTHVESALLEIKKKSLNPNDYVKMKFKNVSAFF